jgi:hypothetical protein
MMLLCYIQGMMLGDGSATGQLVLPWNPCSFVIQLEDVKPNTRGALMSQYCSFQNGRSCLGSSATHVSTFKTF